MRACNYNHFEVNNETIVGNSNDIIGNNNTITGNHNDIVGSNNIITGNNNDIIGNNNIITGNYNVARGNNNKTIGHNNDSRPEPSLGSFSDNKKEKILKFPEESELQHDKEELEEDKEKCVVCLTNKPICIAYPCNHVCACVFCAITLCKGKKRGEVTCPKCRENIKSLTRTF